MLKNWSKFNENVDDLEKVIANKFQEVRDILMELEDDDILHNYSILIRGEDSTGGLTFNPKVGDFNRWFDFTTSQIKNRIKYRKSNTEIENHVLFIVVNIQLPIIKDKIEQGRVSLISPVIDSEGIKKFEDILLVNTRLTSLGYTVNYDLNASHPEYKPLKMLIYFTI